MDTLSELIKVNPRRCSVPGSAFGARAPVGVRRIADPPDAPDRSVFELCEAIRVLLDLVLELVGTLSELGSDASTATGGEGAVGARVEDADEDIGIRRGTSVSWSVSWTCYFYATLLRNSLEFSSSNRFFSFDTASTA